jgi:CRISPR-associated endonuclease Csn1
MDALVIACMTRDHVNLLNNQAAKSETSRYDLQNKLRNRSKEIWIDKKTNEQVERDVFKEFKKPWGDFTVDARNALETVVVSFKQNLRVINKATNNYQKWVDKNGIKVKEYVKQGGTNWAIRKSLHEETISGKVDLPWVKVTKENFLTANRKNLDSSFALEKIKKITDTGIQKILEAHLKRNQNNPELAFSPEGIENMNMSLLELNGGKKHKPIYKVRLYEMGSSRFALGTSRNKQSKYVQGSPNLYFAIYSGNNKKIFETIPLNIVIERLKQGLYAVPEKNSEGFPLQKVLSPLDLVYIPTEEEIDMPDLIDFSKFDKHQRERLYNVNDFSGVTAYFSQNSFAKNIYPKEMDLSWNEKKQKLSGSFDAKTASYNKKPIKDVCIKLNIDRLGNISQ